MGDKTIYIVMSQTGTALSRFLKLVTRKEYNHASLSLRDDLGRMYSFGRKNPYNPFWGGFVIESKDFGTFKRFSETKVQVLALDVSEEQYRKMEEKLQWMIDHPAEYHYNYWGLFLAAFHIPVSATRRYYCSEFVRDFLKEQNVDGVQNLKPIIHPYHFSALPGARTVYTGKLREFSA